MANPSRTEDPRDAHALVVQYRAIQPLTSTTLEYHPELLPVAQAYDHEAVRLASDPAAREVIRKRLEQALAKELFLNNLSRTPSMGWSRNPVKRTFDNIEHYDHFFKPKKIPSDIVQKVPLILEVFELRNHLPIALLFLAAKLDLETRVYNAAKPYSEREFSQAMAAGVQALRPENWMPVTPSRIGLLPPANIVV